MTSQMAELMLRDADTSSGLKRMRALSKENKQRLSEEAEKFKDLEGMHILEPIFGVTVTVLPEFDEVVHAVMKSIVVKAPMDIAWWGTSLMDLTPSPLVRAPSPRRGPPELEAFERERQAFLRIREIHLDDPEFRGKFVAVYGGEIVDQDEDNRELAMRVYREHGYVPIYIGKIERERRVIEMPSPEGL